MGMKDRKDLLDNPFVSWEKVREKTKYVQCMDKEIQNTDSELISERGKKKHDY